MQLYLILFLRQLMWKYHIPKMDMIIHIRVLLLLEMSNPTWCNVSHPQSVSWLGVSLTPKSFFRNPKYNLREIIEWNQFKNLSDHNTQPSSAGLLVQMANPDLDVASERRKEKVDSHISSWNTRQAVVNNQPSGSATAELTASENLLLNVTIKLKNILTKNGSEQCRFRDPQESKKWCHMTPRKIKIWVDAIILARQEDRTDVDLWTPPKLPAFKTFLNGQLPPGYLEFPDNPPPVGFMAAAPAPLPQQPIPSATPAQLHNDRIYQHKYSGDMEDFLNYAEFPESDHTLRTRLSNAHYTRWSELKPSDDMNSQELKVIGIARGDANHLLASAVWYKEFLLAKLAKIDAQQL
ncbi:uncharacterized protein MELLADRAFT_64828 [Melampsora larici-populina 98AG31]|uniref:Uncharacterized protein n=1 Tax=Melampsora larici-populina (strain 98AG31 / pathotype 3-4-7) TaxID=747676 RepID=F4RSY7_MELLP|nr:uncharacterized protein MELLADRAFT_64828 [Melampsora larici-populina 98AG31]EGG04412.1 hypothetical protein MELLADRAFT_64828 [Melampsora larici-populina 98AG31]